MSLALRLLVNRGRREQRRRLMSSSSAAVAATQNHWKNALSCFLNTHRDEYGGVSKSTTNKNVNQVSCAPFGPAASINRWQNDEVAELLRLDDLSRSPTVAASINNSVVSDTETSAPRMQLVLRSFDANRGIDGSPSTEAREDMLPIDLSMLGQAMYLQWRHGFPQPPKCLPPLTHGFFNYPAGMQPASAALMIGVAARKLIAQRDGDRGSDGGKTRIDVYDPCCGSGTTLIEALRVQNTGEFVTRLVATRENDNNDAAANDVAGAVELKSARLPADMVVRAVGSDASPLAVFVACGQTWRPQAHELAMFRHQCDCIVQRAREWESKELLATASSVDDAAEKPVVSGQSALVALRSQIERLRQTGAEEEESDNKPGSGNSGSNGGDGGDNGGPGRRADGITMVGPLLFCYLVTVQRGTPRMSTVDDGGGGSRRKRRRKQWKKRVSAKKAKWQQQWATGRDRSIVDAAAVIDLFEAVAQEYAVRLDWAMANTGALRCTIDRTHQGGAEEEESPAAAATAAEGAFVSLRSVFEPREQQHGEDVDYDAGITEDAPLCGAVAPPPYDCVVTSPPYPAVYDYLSFARHTRADFDKASAPAGQLVMYACYVLS